MHRYRIAGMAVESSIPLPGVLHAAGQKRECIFRCMTSQNFATVDVEPFHHWLDAGDEACAWFFRQEAGYRLRFRNLADFLISADAGEIHCCPLPEVPIETVRHLFLDQVLPLLLSRRGRIVMHASAIATGDGALAFIGKSGHGKSTLAAHFAQNRFSILCDDAMVLMEQAGEKMVVPSYPSIRLWPDTLSALFDARTPTTGVAHYTEKRRLPLGANVASEPVALRRIYILSTKEECTDKEAAGPVQVERLTPSEAMIELSRYTYLLDVTDRRDLRRTFHQLAPLAESIPCYRLYIPYDFSRLPEVCEAVMAESSVAANRRATQG